MHGCHANGRWTLARAKANPKLRGDGVKLLKRLLARGCAHRFSWPRADDTGRYYQICLACGTAYEYDWDEMRRTNNLLIPVIERGLQGDSCSYFRPTRH